MSKKTNIKIKTTVRLKKILRVTPNDQIIKIRVGNYYIDGVRAEPVFHQMLSMLKEYHVWKINVSDVALEIWLKISIDEFIKISEIVAKAESCELYISNKPIIYIDGKVKIISINSVMDPLHVCSTATLPPSPTAMCLHDLIKE